MILYYLIAVNIVGFIAMFADKRKAKKHMRRIPEKTLFLLAFIGGSIGSILGMYIFRHKTKHMSFVIGMPAILIVQLVAYFLITHYIQF